jgi:hypothetical protein
LARTFYQPSACGEHTLYVVATTAGDSSTTRSVSANVTIEPAKAVQDLSKSVASQTMPARLKERLQRILKIAESLFRGNANARGFPS